MTLLQQIYAEIDRRYDEYKAKQKTEDFTYYEGMADALDHLEQFLDTLQEQEPQGLDEAAERYRRDSCNAAMMPNIDGPMPEYGGSVKDAFKAGATWREQQILKLSDNLDEAANEFANQDCVTFISRKKGFIAGAEWMAGQGVTFNAAVDYDEGFYIDSEEQETKAIEKLGLKVMDWVIVQIRKK